MLVLAALPLVALGACAPLPSLPAEGRPDDVGVLVASEREWSAAVLRHDAQAVARLLSDDYVGIDGRGMISSKVDEIQDAAPSGSHPGSDFIIESEEILDPRVRVYGETAIVNARSVERVRVKGESKSVQYRRTTVWLRKTVGWQCVSFHASRLPAPLPVP